MSLGQPSHTCPNTSIMNTGKKYEKLIETKELNNFIE